MPSLRLYVALRNLPGDLKNCGLLFPSGRSVSLHCKVLNKLPFISSRNSLHLDVKDAVLSLELLQRFKIQRILNIAFYAFFMLNLYFMCALFVEDVWKETRDKPTFQVAF